MQIVIELRLSSTVCILITVAVATTTKSFWGETIMVRQHFETMIIRGKSDDMGAEIDPNQDTAIDDMTGYIERMGGRIHSVVVESEWVFYSFIVPSHWVGRMYDRFKSFGFRAKVKPESHWFGVLDEKLEEERSEGYKPVDI